VSEKRALLTRYDTDISIILRGERPWSIQGTSQPLARQALERGRLGRRDIDFSR
jgi:hypothetical protein